VKVESDDPKIRGKHLATQMESSIRAFYDHFMQAFDKKKISDLWIPLAQNMTSYVKQYAPVAYAELQGYSQVFTELEMMMFASQWEFLVLSGNMKMGRCTSFAVNGFVTKTGELISGQTNDEDPSSVLNGTLDVILHIKSSSNQVLVYTHPGLPAYFGRNSHGLNVFNTYIDTGDYSETGLPTGIILRELMSKTTVAEAVSWLKNVPLLICNQFLLSSPDEGIVSVEACPNHRSVSVQMKTGEVFYTNHVLFDQYLASKDLKIDSTSEHRLQTVRKGFQDDMGQVDVSVAKSVMLDPIITRDHTMATLISIGNDFLVKFRGEDEWRTYSFD